jgi:phenylalanyl-tRNA synthetase alpha subunit
MLFIEIMNNNERWMPEYFPITKLTLSLSDRWVKDKRKLELCPKDTNAPTDIIN